MFYATQKRELPSAYRLFTGMRDFTCMYLVCAEFWFCGLFDQRVKNRSSCDYSVVVDDGAFIENNDKVKIECFQDTIGVVYNAEMMAAIYVRWAGHVRSIPTEAPLRNVDQIENVQLKEAE